MKNVMELIVSAAIICMMLVTSCATTTVRSVWRDDNYQQQIRKVLVIGVSKRPAIRRLFELEFAKQLRSHGIEAVPSHQILPSEGMIDKMVVASKVKELGVDTVLITKLLGREKVTTYIPPQRRGWHSHYRMSYGYVYSPGYLVEDDVVSLETNLYDTGTERLVWSALSETFISSSDVELIKEFIKIIIDKLDDEKLLG